MCCERYKQWQYAKEQLEKAVLFCIEILGFILIQEMTPYLFLFICTVMAVIGRKFLLGSSRILFRIIRKAYFVFFFKKYD